MSRKKRVGEHICYCRAYSFPHRFGGGKCTGYNFVSEHWHTYFGYNESCENCHHNSKHSCDVVQGIEQPLECTELQEFINFNEIKL